MNIRPLHDRVIVEPLEAEQKTAGGIIIPDTAQEKPSEGKVVAVGPGARDADGKRHKLSVKKGDRILYGKWSGTEVKVEGKDLLIIQEGDILGILDSKAVVQAKGKVAAAGGTATGHTHVPGMDCC
ncbi:MAG: co-chaperone GroES [Alphaproteobacteria bacterium]|nr:co-chaperone GroES [Alphaproteobacteria bacterium]